MNIRVYNAIRDSMAEPSVPQPDSSSVTIEYWMARRDMKFMMDHQNKTANAAQVQSFVRYYFGYAYSKQEVRFFLNALEQCRRR